MTELVVSYFHDGNAVNHLLVYDITKLIKWSEKCLETLKRVKNIPDEINLRPHETWPCEARPEIGIHFGWNYKWHNHNNASFGTDLWYNDLEDIFGIQNNELNITNPTLKQELEVCKLIMAELWEQYVAHKGIL